MNWFRNQDFLQRYVQKFAWRSMQNTEISLKMFARDSIQCLFCILSRISSLISTASFLDILTFLTEFFPRVLPEFFLEINRRFLKYFFQDLMICFENFQCSFRNSECLPGITERVSFIISAEVFHEIFAEVFPGISYRGFPSITPRKFQGFPSGDPNKVLPEYLQRFPLVGFPRWQKDFCRSSSRDFLRRSLSRCSFESCPRHPPPEIIDRSFSEMSQIFLSIGSFFLQQLLSKFLPRLLQDSSRYFSGNLLQ